MENNGKSPSDFPSLRDQERAIREQEIDPNFMSVKRVCLQKVGLDDNPVYLQYDEDGNTQYAIERDGVVEQMPGGIITDFPPVDEGPRLPVESIALFDEKVDGFIKMNNNPEKMAMFLAGVGSVGELRNTLNEAANPVQKALLNDQDIDAGAAFLQVAREQHDALRQEAIISLEGGLVENEGKITIAKGKIAENNERIAAIKANMADIKVQMAEKQAIVDKYDKNKPWLMKLVDFVSENFWACLGIGVGVVGLSSAPSTPMFLLAGTVAAVSGLIAADVIDEGSLMKQGKSLLNQASTAFGIDSVDNDVPASRNTPDFNLALTPS